MAATLEIFPGQGNGLSIGEIFNSSLAKHKELVRDGTKPVFLFGYSYGLYAALAVSEVLNYKDALELALLRETLVLQSEASAPFKSVMLSVFGICRRAGEVLARDYGLYVSNDNGPSLQVLSGYVDRVEKLEEDAALLNLRKTRRLPIEGAYHVPIPERIKDSLKYKCKIMNYEFKNPRIPLISSTKPRVMVCAQDIKEELVRQMVRPVELVQAVNLWQSLGVEEVAEAGVGDVKKMAERILKIENVAARP